MTASTDDALGLCIVGCGALGVTLIEACLDSGTVSPQSCIGIESNTERAKQVFERTGCAVHALPGDFVRAASVVTLVVKPAEAEAACRAVAPFLGSHQIVLSVMAGVSLGSLQAWLGTNAPLTRAMPNLPARYREGVTAFFAPPGAVGQRFEEVERILRALGQVVRVDREELVDAATAVAGSGPAYFFYLAEHLEAVARELGFSDAQAQELVRTTMRGAARMLLEEKVSADVLRDRVTSKRGTTEAAFEIVEKAKVGEILRQAFRRAFERAREMSKG